MQLVSVTVAAKHYGVTKLTVYRWIKRGYLVAERIGPRTLRVPLGQKPPDDSAAPREAASEGQPAAVKRPRGKKIRGLVKRPRKGQR